jgi:arginyl-tRNA synthetase
LYSKGTVVFLEEILNEAKQVMLEKIMENTKQKLDEVEDPEKTADIVGLSAVVIQDLSARRIRDYDFSWDRMTNKEGNTGPYLQYAHARLCSMDDKTKDVPVEFVLCVFQSRLAWSR